MRVARLFICSFAAWLLFASTKVDADETLKEEGTSSITFHINRHSEGLAVIDAVEQRTWFELSEVPDYENGCGAGGVRLTKYEQWTEYWIGGGHAGAGVPRFQIGVYSVDDSGTKVLLHSISAQPDVVEGFEANQMAYTGYDIQQSNGYFAIRLGPEPYRNYERETGRLLFMSDAAGLAATVAGEHPCEDERHVAYTTFYPKLMVGLPDGEEFIASISYSSNAGVLQTAIVTAPRGWRDRLGLPPDFEGKGELELVSSRWVYDEYATVVGPRRVDFGSRETVTAVLRLGERSETVAIEIPLAEDRMIIDEAKLPIGFSITQWQ